MVDVVLEIPDEPPRCLFVFAHGAGAGMTHPFMEKLAHSLVGLKVGVVRFNFPYMQNKKSQTDKPEVAQNCMIQVMQWARSKVPQVPLFIGGKSFGGRMSSHIPLSEVGIAGLILVSYPFHAPGKPSAERSVHFKSLTLPVLIIQGSKDTFATQPWADQALSWLPVHQITWLDGYDHGLTNKKNPQIFSQLAYIIDQWLREKFGC